MSNDRGFSSGWKTSQSIADFKEIGLIAQPTTPSHPLKLREPLTRLSDDLDPADRRDRLGRYQVFRGASLCS